MIDITGVDLVKFAQKVYALSVPRGAGFMHHTFDPLSDEEAKSLIQPTGRIAISMDYIRGRGCKMVVFRELPNGPLTVNDSWYDHTDADLDCLLSEFGLSRRGEKVEHGMACDCADCNAKRKAVRK